ncbi:unnamed protein product [Dibothriocephalus latus]|uniref:Enolase n=1 Tax=Dibothriocephalus latus TaxID=60516 RepID=A0A3P7P891_DIBLA|nr:unnamed protein product [Dibothriocephalus latus]
MSIQSIHARQIFDSRGNPTVEVDLKTAKGMFRAAVPSGASTGVHEAVELRDGIKDQYMGKGVLKAVDNVNKVIAPALIKENIPVTEQKKIDEFMIKLDGTENKGKLGANAILGVSLAVCKAGAAEKASLSLSRNFNFSTASEPLFILLSSILVGRPPLPSFTEAMKMGSEVYHNLKSVIKAKYGLDACNVGDEGGFAPNIQDNMEGLELLKTAIDKAGYTGKVKIGMDVAASEFYQNGKYNLDFKNPKADPSSFITADQLSNIYTEMKSKYPIVSIEDPFDQDDWSAWTAFTAKAGIQIVGDDLTVTNPKRVKKAIDTKACNALLLKVNQIGSVTESIEACNMSKKGGWGVMVSHRSGETEDSTIADIVVGLRTGQIKTGAPCRSERLAKYNQLLRIEEELGSKAIYAGEKFRNP